jgi:UDP-N-acetylmuramate dehydrogenase
MQMYNNYSLTHLNTLRLNSTATTYTPLTQIQQLPDIIAYVQTSGDKFFVLGGGSNIILPKIYPGVVIHNKLGGIELLRQDKEHAYIKVMAGEIWDDFVAYTLNHEWYGLENLSLIPGTVGAAPIQNIGAYGVEVKNFIDHVEVYDSKTNQFTQLSNLDCGFSYRNSYFKTNLHLIVTAVIFKLSLTPKLNISYADIARQLEEFPHATPLDLRNCVIKTRRNKLPDPAVIGNAGSFFHNPILTVDKVNELKAKYPDLPVYKQPDEMVVKVSAGWLIDSLGLKGYRQGMVGTYDKQALVLVNHGGVTANDILGFAKFIQAKVLDNYGISLNIEPIVV